MQLKKKKFSKMTRKNYTDKEHKESRSIKNKAETLN